MRSCPEKVLLLILTVWTMCFEQIQAQSFPVGLPEIKNFTSKDYQWHPKNFQVTQGGNGLIYVGNSYGILEFDGKMWRKVLLPNGLDGHTLKTDPVGNVYAGSFNEFGKLVTAKSGQTVFHSLLQKPSKAFGEIIGIWFTPNHIILASDEVIYEYSNGSFTPLFSEPQGFSFIEVVQQKLYYQTENGTLSVFDLINQQQTKKHQVSNKVIGLTDSYALLVNGLFFNLKNGMTKKPTELPQRFEVRKAIQLKSGNLALASSNHGLIILNKDLELVHHINSQRGLLSDNIFDLSEDRENNLWLALDNGISHITLNTPFTHYGMSNGIRGMGYTSAIHDNRLFLGTSQGVFTHNNQDEFRLIKGLEGQIYELQSSGSRLFIAHEDGLYTWQNSKIKFLFDEHKIWTIRIIPHQEQKLLLGSELGLFVLDLSNWSIKSIQGFNESSRIVAFDLDQQLWICHGNKGLYRLAIDFDKLAVQNTVFYSQEKGNLPAYITFVSPSKKGLLFSGDDGVYQFDPANNTFIPNSEINGFLKHNFYVDKIIEGTFKSLWIIQDNKITKLDPLDNGSYTLLPENLITELNGDLVGSYEYLHVYDSNNVIIGTQEGFAHFNVNSNINYRINSEKNISQTVIREVKFEQTDSSLFAPIAIESPLVLPYDFNNVTFSYAPGYYQSREQIRFSFFLESKGSTNQPYWSDWHESNQNSFKNLSPGNYVFHVRSRGDLFKKSKTISYPFVIQSPWYATKWSGAFYTLLLISIGMFIYKIRVARLKKEKQIALLKKDEELEQQKLLAETEKIKLINERLKEKVLLKNKELGSVALEITKKNEFLAQLKKGLTQISATVTQESAQKIKRSIRSIDQNMRSDNNWERFEMYFDESHQDFIKKLKEKQPDLTKSSINLCAFLKLDLSSKEIASLMNISVSGVEKRRYRLRKKLDLDSDTNLRAFLDTI